MVDVQSTPAERQMAWVLERLRAPGSVSDAEANERFELSAWGRSPIQEMDELRQAFGDAFAVEGELSHSEDHLEVVVAAGDRRWLVTCHIEPDAPQRIRDLWFRPAPPPGTVIRHWEPEDGPALADLERRSPLRLGDTKVTYDRGDDYFATAHLMENLTILVGLVDGMHAGVYWGAVQHVRIGGEPRKLLLEHRVRVLPEYQKGGVFWSMVGEVRGMHGPHVDSIAFYVSPQNERTRRHVEDTPRWKTEPVRMLLRCADLADAGLSGGNRGAEPPDAGRLGGDRGAEPPDAGRLGGNRGAEPPDAGRLGGNRGAEPPDAGRLGGNRGAEPPDADRMLNPAIQSAQIAEVLNACHEREELFVPYTSESLSGRLGRAPVYAWSGVRILGDAVVGVGTSTLRMTFETGDDRRETVRATALDHGFAPGGEREYETLLRAWCAELAARGVDELAVFTCPGATTYPVLERLASERESFLFWTFDLEEPADTPERGLYVDPVYF